MVALELPTVPRARPKPSLEGGTHLYFGPPKSGKTPFALTFPGVCLIDCEHGARHYGGMIIDVLDIARAEAAEAVEQAKTSEEKERAKRVLARGGNPLDVLRRLISMLRRDNPYQTVAIDSITAVARWFEPEAVASMNSKHKRNGSQERPYYDNISDPGEGAGWTEWRSMVMAFLDVFVELPCTKIIIAHSKMMITEELGTTTKVLDLAGKLGHWAPSKADHFGAVRFDAEKGKPMVSFSGYEVMTKKGHSIVHGGSRLPELAGKEIEATYDALVAAMNGGE